MNPLVSVIVPSYNHAAYLQERLDSILAQSYTNFEVIIIDDASQDDSKKIISNYCNHPKVAQIIYNETNTGSPFSQWQKGFELATGKYIWIAESDDMCSDLFLETLTTILEKDDSLSLVYVDSECNIEDWKDCKIGNQQNNQYYNGSDFIKQHMLTNPIIVNASAVLFRKNAVKKDIFKFTSFYKTAFDWLFWCDILMCGKVAYHPQKLNFFRQHQANTSSKNNLKGLFVKEGLQVISYLKKTYHFQLNLSQLKTWASVWAQTGLLTGKAKLLFLNSISSAWFISPKCLFYYLYYTLKFKFISVPNINLR